MAINEYLLTLQHKIQNRTEQSRTEIGTRTEQKRTEQNQHENRTSKEQDRRRTTNKTSAFMKTCSRQLQHKNLRLDQIFVLIS